MNISNEDIWDERPLEQGTIIERLEIQFDKFRENNQLTAVKNNLLRSDIREIWTSFLLKEKESVTKRLKSLGHEIPSESYVKIYEQFSRDSKINVTIRNLAKSVLLDIDPQDSSQEAVESFLRGINDKYESCFTLDDFDAYARNRVFADKNQEVKEKRKIEFSRKFENKITQECVIPQRISLESLESERKSESILEGFLNKDAPTLITASGGTGKSALVLNMALALGSKDTDKWLGFQKGKSKYTSIIVQQEDSEHTITERLGLMCKNTALKDGINSLFFLGNSFKVTNKSLSADGEGSLVEYITTNLKNLFISGEEIPDLLILDSLSVFAGCSENDSTSMRTVTGKLFSLCAKFGMTPIIIHHHGKDAKYRGSSAIVESVRCHYTLRSVGGDKADKVFSDLNIGETVHLNRIERPKANDLYGKFEVTYVCNNMIFKTVEQALLDAGKTPEAEKNDKFQKIRDIVDGKVLGSDELTKLIMENFDIKDRSAKDSMSKAVKENYICMEKIGRNIYYFTNKDDFENLKVKYNEQYM
nr:AAA family ATPase [uncultured Desulfobulbus sp.]